jgi:2,3-diketo-5-methylthio-1-phosphopentane phosphatase
MNPPRRTIRLFVDFDGTVTAQDVGSGIFSKFMQSDRESHDAIIRDWKLGLISSRECLERECRSVAVTESVLNHDIDTYALTPGFRETAGYCRERGIPLVILSDGMDYYIRRLLERNGLGFVPFFSNRMWFENGGVACDFPYLEKGCGKCGNCKRYHMNRLTRAGDHVVYAGDGYSDRYAIMNAHTIFARDELAGYCRERGIPFIRFEDFHPIRAFLEAFHAPV